MDFINFESKGKFFISLGLILLIMSFVYPLFILWLFDVGSTKYIETELLMQKTSNLSNETISYIGDIQKQD